MGIRKWEESNDGKRTQGSRKGTKDEGRERPGMSFNPLT
jgi:hypothetical protein